MLKNKILILFFITLIVFIFFCSSVYATEESLDTFNFTGFDDKNYSLPILPDELKNYNHYVIIFDDISSYYYLIPFNESFEIKRDGSYNNILCDGTQFSSHFTCSTTAETWNFSYSQFAFHTYESIIYSCPCLQSYSNELNSGMTNETGFFLNRQEILVPIMEKAPLAMVLQEILEILPIILMTIVGLIGLRKALKFLSTVLHRS